MATWVIIAALATIGVTAILTGVLYRLNAGALARQERVHVDGGIPTFEAGAQKTSSDVGPTDAGGEGGGD